MASTWSLVKLRNQEPSTGFQHPVHLCDSGRLVVLGHVVQSESARDRVESGIREREVLRKRDLERRGYAAPARLAAGAVDHLHCCINPVDRAGGCHPLGEDDGKAARATANIQDAVAWLELKIISQHDAEALPAAAEQPGPEVVNTSPADEPVAAVVISMAGGVGHWHSLPEFPSVGSVRLATWNVNSIKQRVPRLLPWLDERRPDVVCLQETKLSDEAFTRLLGEQLDSRGYEFAVHGEVQWNGVAILSRVGLGDVVTGVAGAPGFPHPEARAVSATCGGIRVHSVYVPNGRVPDSDHYRYKLDWLAALAERLRNGPQEAVVCGDMNIAPADEDVFDPEAYVGQTHVTAPEREALARLQGLGLRDVVRDRWPGKRVFTYWDYRAGMFHQDLGMRIDLVLATEPVAERVRAAWVDRQARKGSGPSDHAPVIVDLDEAPDGDIGPVVPPPSAPATRRVRLPQSRGR
jgi:exodeoxyribonuclease-3